MAQEMEVPSSERSCCNCLARVMLYCFVLNGEPSMWCIECLNRGLVGIEVNGNFLHVAQFEKEKWQL